MFCPRKKRITKKDNKLGIIDVGISSRYCVNLRFFFLPRRMRTGHKKAMIPSNQERRALRKGLQPLYPPPAPDDGAAAGYSGFAQVGTTSH